MSFGSNRAGAVAGDVAREAGKQAARRLLLKAAAAVLLSQAGLVMLILLIGAVMAMAILGFASQDDPDCDTASGPTYVSSASSEEALADIPGDYLELYKQAAEEYGIDWAILAAVGKIESDHGRLNAPGVTEGQNQHGCCAGPMQFHNNYGEGGGTWGAVAVDGNGDGKKDIYDPEDAIPSAAKYLVQGGAPEDYQSALFQYNNAQWYVDDVLAQADKYRAADGGGSDDNRVPALLPSAPLELMPKAHAQESTNGSGVGSGGQAVSPLPEDRMGEYSDDWGAERPGFAGSTHEGTDIFAKKGTPISSMVSGTVEENTNNNENSYSEVGGYNVMIRATEDVGPVKKGDLLMYAHMQEPPSVKPGDEVTAGEQIGKVGATGYGPEVTRDKFDPHLHVGWYTEDEQRADSASGAMNPYPLLEWVKNNGGEAAGSETENVAPTAAPTPKECKQPSSGTGTGSGKGGGKIMGSASGKAVLEEARKYDGTAYDIYSCQPGQLMDCSCLTMTVFKKFGIDLPWPVMEQTNYGKPVEGEPQAGDLIFYGPGGGYPGHVGIANGKGGMFHCASPALGCLESPDYKAAGPTPVMEVRRLVGEEGGGGGK